MGKRRGRPRSNRPRYPNGNTVVNKDVKAWTPEAQHHRERLVGKWENCMRDAMADEALGIARRNGILDGDNDAADVRYRAGEAYRSLHIRFCAMKGLRSRQMRQPSGAALDCREIDDKTMTDMQEKMDAADDAARLAHPLGLIAVDTLLVDNVLTPRMAEKGTKANVGMLAALDALARHFRIYARRVA